MALQKCLAKIELISDRLCSKFQEFNESLEEIVSTGSHLSDDKESGCLRALYNNLKSNSETTVASAENHLRDHFEVLEKKRQDINCLKDKLTLLCAQCESEKKEIAKVTKRTEVVKKKLEDLQSLKDCIKTWKLLTGTDFVYESYQTKTTGYMKDNFSNYEVFDFNNSETSDQEITEKLWSLLQEVSKKDSGNKFEVILNTNKKLILS